MVYELPEVSKKQFIEVVNYVTNKEDKRIRPSELQIKFRWGYNLAGRVLELLRILQIVDDSQGVAGRKVLMSNDEAQYIISGMD